MFILFFIVEVSEPSHDSKLLVSIVIPGGSYQHYHYYCVYDVVQVMSSAPPGL